MQWLQVGIFTDSVLRERQCTLEGAWYMNICGSVQWGCKFFKFIIEIDQSQMSDRKIASKGKMLLTAK